MFQDNLSHGMLTKIQTGWHLRDENQKKKRVQLYSMYKLFTVHSTIHILYLFFVYD